MSWDRRRGAGVDLLGPQFRHSACYEGLAVTVDWKGKGDQFSANFSTGHSGRGHLSIEEGGARGDTMG
jgi:hypothetical protein